MSMLVLLVILLLFLSGTLTIGALVYVARRHPTWVQPLLVGLAGVTALASIVAPVVSR